MSEIFMLLVKLYGPLTPAEQKALAALVNAIEKRLDR